MILKDFYHEAHHLVEAEEKRRITHEEMAARIGVSKRAYSEWLKGGREPIAVSSAIRMLTLLEDAEIVRLVRHFSTDKNKEGRN